MQFKAKSFLGIFSIRNGCFVSCILQVAVGVIVWASLSYLRPMLKVFNIIVMSYFIAGAVFGIYAIWKRSEILTWLYLIQLGSCVTIVLLLCLDYAGIFHILPKPPVAPSVPIKPPIIQKLEKLEETVTSRVGAMVPEALKGTAETEKPAKGALLLEAFRHNRRAPLPREAPVGFPAAAFDARRLQPRRSAFAAMEAHAAAPPAAPAVRPLTAQTEGQAEEVARDEIPTEVRGLPVDMQKQVSATTKIVKHVVKFVFSGILCVLFFLQIYCSYIVFTFLLNKCTSLDELTEQPEQFEPIIQAESATTFAEPPQPLAQATSAVTEHA